MAAIYAPPEFMVPASAVAQQAPGFVGLDTNKDPLVTAVTTEHLAPASAVLTSAGMDSGAGSGSADWFQPSAAQQFASLFDESKVDTTRVSAVVEQSPVSSSVPVATPMAETELWNGIEGPIPDFYSSNAGSLSFFTAPQAEVEAAMNTDEAAAPVSRVALPAQEFKL